MAAQVWKKTLDVGNRLDGLFKLRREQLLEVVEAMVRAKADCTPNDPPGSRGWSAYKMGTRRLREITLVEKGWEKDDADQIPRGNQQIVGRANRCRKYRRCDGHRTRQPQPAKSVPKGRSN